MHNRLGVFLMITILTAALLGGWLGGPLGASPPSEADTDRLLKVFSEALAAIQEHYVEPIPFVPAYSAAVPGRYNSEVIVQRGYWMVNWFKREFAQQEVQQAQELGVSPETLFESFLHESPPGAMGLVLLVVGGSLFIEAFAR